MVIVGNDYIIGLIYAAPPMPLRLLDSRAAKGHNFTPNIITVLLPAARMIWPLLMVALKCRHIRHQCREELLRARVSRPMAARAPMTDK